jgi:hypothetical protein
VPARRIRTHRQRTNHGQLVRRVDGKLKRGQTISITDDAGRRIDGRLTEVSASSIRVLSRGVQQTLTQDHVLRPEWALE